MKSQAERVIAKFGGARNLARALQALGDESQIRSPAVIYRWTYPKTRGGTGGKIPSSAMDAVMRAARLDGVLITMDDLYGELK